MSLSAFKKDIVILHNLELIFNPKLFINKKDSFQMTLNLSKDGNYYSCYLQDWSVLSQLLKKKKSDLVSIAGSFKIVQKQNANGYTKYTMKLTPSEMEMDNVRWEVDPDANNNAGMRLLLLKYAYVNLEDEEKISCSLTAEELIKEMKGTLMDAFDSTRGRDMLELLKSKKDKINEDLYSKKSFKKRKLNVEGGGIFCVPCVHINNV